MGLIQRMVRRIGLAEAIDANVKVLEIHKPYDESDHVLNIAYNVLCGGERLDDIELRWNDRVMLDALNTASLPDPTTAGDFCRRFEGDSIFGLMKGINETRLEVWKRQPDTFRGTARIDADGSIIRPWVSASKGWTSRTTGSGVTARWCVIGQALSRTKRSAASDAKRIVRPGPQSS